MNAYYNEHDKMAAEWLRELIADGLIAPGVVDERSIEDVRPSDLAGFVQCHFFAGIGVWSYAARRAGWSDNRPLWTGSCPCPPFSSAGKGSECPSCGGKSCLSHPVVTAGWICLDCGDEWRGDHRHLLPEFLRLIGQCRPPEFFGEQVASRDGVLWLYSLRSVVEACGYALGAADMPSAGFGAPHIRQRLFFGASRVEHASGNGRVEWRTEPGRRGVAGGRSTGGLDDDDDEGLEGLGRGHRSEGGYGEGSLRPATAAGEPRRMADLHGDRRAQERFRVASAQCDGFERDRALDRPGPTNGWWRDADWLGCRDAKWRPVEPGTLPLVDGAPRGMGRGRDPSESIILPTGEARVGRLRGYGNAINAIQAEEFIRAFDGACGDLRRPADLASRSIEELFS